MSRVAFVISHSDCRGHDSGQSPLSRPSQPRQPIVYCPDYVSSFNGSFKPLCDWWTLWLTMSFSLVICTVKSCPASSMPDVSIFATNVHGHGTLAATEFKVASIQLEPNEIPFQPLEWPGELQPRGPRWYNDAWHNSPTVLRLVPRKPHNMCHCAMCFAAQPRCPALATDTRGLAVQ